MGFEVQFSPHALDDIEDAFHYYNSNQGGLGQRFVNEVNSAISRILENPFKYALRYDQVRCASVWKFPFLVHFHVREPSEAVIILAVYSTYKRPLWEKSPDQ